MKKQFANSSHTHNISDIGNLQNELNLRVVGPSVTIDLGQIVVNESGSTSKTLGAPIRNYQENTNNINFIGARKTYNKYCDIYLPSGGRYHVFNINAENFYMGEDNDVSLVFENKISAGDYNGGTKVCRFNVYNRTGGDYSTTFSITFQRIE